MVDLRFKLPVKKTYILCKKCHKQIRYNKDNKICFDCDTLKINQLKE